MYIKSLVEKRQWQRCEKYCRMLLWNRIRLSDIPASVRLHSRWAPTIHAHAFRASRSVSKEQYQQDLQFLQSELLMLGKDDPLRQILQHILETRTEDLKHIKF